MFFDEKFNTIQKELQELKAAIEKKPDKLDKDAYERIADLEVKMVKLWSLLLETSVTGKERLTKFGKKFGGQSKMFIGNSQ